MSRTSTRSEELSALREKRVDLMISISVMEERGAARADIELERVALLTVNSKITAIEKTRLIASSSGRGASDG